MEYPDSYELSVEGCRQIFARDNDHQGAVLGMAASLSKFAKGKTRQNRNEPITAKMTHGTGRRDCFAISCCVLRILLEADINNI